MSFVASCCRSTKLFVHPLPTPAAVLSKFSFLLLNALHVKRGTAVRQNPTDCLLQKSLGDAFCVGLRSNLAAKAINC